MSGSFIFLLALACFIVVAVIKAVVIVPPGEPWVVQYLGRNVREVPAGLVLIKPFVERAGPKSEFGDLQKP